MGIEAPKQLGQPLRKGMEVFMGASSSPTFITITKVDDDTIYYRTEHDPETRAIQRWIGEDLIAKGTNTWLDSGYPKHFPDLAVKLRRLVGRSGTANPGTKSNPDTTRLKRRLMRK